MTDTGGPTPLDTTMLRARAVVLHDVAARGADTADIVDVVDSAVAERRWWAQQWPAGLAFVAGQVAQDVQDRLVDTEGRWPSCPNHADEALALDPPLGEDPRWVCERGCGIIAPLGALPPAAG